MNDLKRAWALPGFALLLSACATEPTYSPPEGPRAAEVCPVGEVWVCRDHYPSRLDKDDVPPMYCMCQNPAAVR